jgi:amino acid transporter
VRIVRSRDLPVKRIAGDHYIAPDIQPRTRVGRSYRRLRRVLIGRPLATAEAENERLGKAKALAVFSSDALSSVAYATQEMMIILALAGAAALTWSLPLGVGIVILLAIVVASYRQTVQAYPSSGGAYVVARENLGLYPGLTAASALLVAYVLTVAVSVSAAAEAVISAFPTWRDYRVELAVVAVLFVMIANLRGVSESGTIFSIPTFLFIGSMFVLIGLGLASVLGAGVEARPPRYEPEDASRDLTIVLLARAFAAGGAALTGVEAISNGVSAFKQPQARNAATTLVWMGALLGAMFLGVTWLAHHYALVPSEDETIVSQLARTLVGQSPFYYLVQVVTALILILAANTAFADFPRLASYLARDTFLPHQFLFRGDRLAFTTGIVALGLISCVLVVGFGANVTSLIPMYAVGVFLSFTLSETGMTRHWLRAPHGRERTVGLLLNGGGALATGGVLLTVVSTRLFEGAWIIVLVLPIIIVGLRGVYWHYQDVADQLRISPAETRHRLRPGAHEIAALVPIASLNVASVRAIEYALSVTTDVTAVHVSSEIEDAEDLRRDWETAGIRVPLVIIDSPFRSLIGPFVAYVEHLQLERGQKIVNVILPEFVPAHLGEHLLHNQSALRLKAALLFRRNVVVTDVPYHLED